MSALDITEALGPNFSETTGALLLASAGSASTAVFSLHNIKSCDDIDVVSIEQLGDTYAMEFKRWTSSPWPSYQVVKSARVSVDQLRSTFTQFTGIACSENQYSTSTELTARQAAMKARVYEALAAMAPGSCSSKWDVLVWKSEGCRYRVGHSIKITDPLLDCDDATMAVLKLSSCFASN